MLQRHFISERKLHGMLKPVRRLITAGSLLVLTAIIFLLAKYLPQFWFSFYPDASKAALAGIGAVTGLVPFCLWEILLLGIVIWGIVSFVLAIKNKHVLSWLTGVLELAALLVFLFVALWGLNHFGPKVSEKLSLDVREYSVEELESATRYYAAMADKYANEVGRDEDGALVAPSFRELAAQGVADADAMEQPLFRAASRSVKPLLSSRLFSYMGITGIYLDLTAESCVNTETFIASLPYTIAHELSHSCAVSAEDDANYCAFLICENSENTLSRYSGYYSAYIYCHNALYKYAPETASEILSQTGELLRGDFRRSNEHYAQFEGPVKEVSEKVNDTYLKTFGEEKGVQSYGAVADMLIAHYLSGNADKTVFG